MISQITDRLYVGDSTFCREDLEKLGITHIINVGGVKLPHDLVFYSLHLTDDGENPSWKAPTILRRLEALLTRSRSGRVLICCRAGMSRSVFIVLLWLEKTGMSRDEAYEFIKERHPMAQINLDLLRSVYE